MSNLSPGILATCRWCGHRQNIPIHPNDHTAWRDGTLLQHAAPYLEDDEREMLISETCSPCWDDMFPEETP